MWDLCRTETNKCLFLSIRSHPEGKFPGIERDLFFHIYGIFGRKSCYLGHQKEYARWVRPGAAHSHPQQWGTQEQITASC